MRFGPSTITLMSALAAAVPAVVAPFTAQAAAPQVRPFDEAAFAAAQMSGKPILVWVHAPWCPVCRAQEKTIARVTADPAYRDMQIFRIDFDTQKSLWQRFGAREQSTLIGFRGARETGRVAHDTDDGKVSAVIWSAIA